MEREEMETIVNFNDAEPVASVYTLNKALQNRLAKLAAERPEECIADPDARLSDGMAVSYIVPKKWIKVSPPREVVLSEEQKQRYRERMKAVRAAKVCNI